MTISKEKFWDDLKSPPPHERNCSNCGRHDPEYYKNTSYNTCKYHLDIYWNECAADLLGGDPPRNWVLVDPGE